MLEEPALKQTYTLFSLANVAISSRTFVLSPFIGAIYKSLEFFIASKLMSDFLI